MVETTSSYSLPLDAFIRAMGVNRTFPHTFFLGAGASISSGIPSADYCIWEWKRRIFLTMNPGLEAQFSDHSLPIIRQRIQHWLDSRGVYDLAPVLWTVSLGSEQAFVGVG